MHIDMKYLRNYSKHYYNGKKMRQYKINLKKTYEEAPKGTENTLSGPGV